MASVDEFGSFAQKILQVSGTGGTACVWNDAIRAEEIATFLDFEICSRSFIVERKARTEKIFRSISRRGKKRLALTHDLVAKQLAKWSRLRIRHNQIDFRILFHVRDGRFTTHQHDTRVRQTFSRRTDGLPRFLGGNARDGATVDDDDIRRLAPWHGLVTMCGQIARDGGRIGLVETASKRMNGKS